jgi:hypothetical protein
MNEMLVNLSLAGGLLIMLMGYRIVSSRRENRREAQLPPRLRKRFWLRRALGSLGSSEPVTPPNSAFTTTGNPRNDAA